MDLIVLIIVLAVIGFAVHVITTRIPMDPMIRTIILVVVVIALVLFLLRRVGGIPNVL